MNMNLKKSFTILMSLTSIVLVSCGPEKWRDGTFDAFEETVLIDPTTVTLEANDSHTDLQKAYILSTWDTANEFAEGRSERSKPRPIQIAKQNESDTKLEFATDNQFKNNKVTFTYDEAGNSNVENLLANTKYYYRSFDSDANSATIKEFTTSNLLPRNLNIDGVTNVRDLGGYTSKLGGTIKQNMYIRGGALTEGRREPRLLISEEGLAELTQTIGVKTDLDLRNTDVDSKGLCETGFMNNETIKELNYISVSMHYSTYDDVNIMLTQKEAIKKVFDVYSNVDNYPVYVHCSIGTDRTGLISYLMGALLGMDNESLHSDYLFSNFGEIHKGRTIKDIKERYYPALLEYQKPTLQLCVEAYLLDIGITQDQIETIKNIMIEK